jgi:putative phosphoribosyl transferase
MNTSATQSSIIHVHIPCAREAIHGELAIPDAPNGLVIFAHATQGGWANSKNWSIAWKLHQRGYATLLLDLLTGVEAGLETAKGLLHFEVPLLSERLRAATLWALSQEKLKGLEFAFFGSDVGAAAAIEVAGALPATSAVVCRAARTDLVEGAADQLGKPILLIAAEYDRRTIRRNREFIQRNNANRRLEIVKGATHRFPEEGALCEVARITAKWLDAHLGAERSNLEEAVSADNRDLVSARLPDLRICTTLATPW